MAALTKYHYHEAMERVEMLREIIHGSIQPHAVIEENPKLAELAEKLQDAAGDLYQAIAAECHNYENQAPGGESLPLRIVSQPGKPRATNGMPVKK